MIERVMYASNVLTVSEGDVALLKKVVYASGGNGGFGISKSEAAFLFELDESTKGAGNHDSWQKLFVGAIANHLMTMGAPEPVDREAYKRAQEYLMTDGGIQWEKMELEWKNLPGQLFGFLTEKPRKSQFTDHNRMNEAEKIDMSEAQWLIDHLNRDGEISVNEKALLTFIKNECPDIHEALHPLLKYAA